MIHAHARAVDRVRDIDTAAAQHEKVLATWRRLRLVIPILVSVVSCHSSGLVVVPAGTRIRGTVRDAHERPVEHAAVIVTSRKSSNELAATSTNSAGEFEIALGVEDVALSVATERGWAFVPQVRGGQRELKLRLDDKCTVLEGVVKLDDEESIAGIDLVRVGRFGDNVGDVFGARISSDGKFRTCVPEAEYYIEMPKSFVERIVLTSVPGQSPLMVHSASVQRIRTRPAQRLQLSSTGLEGFVDGVAPTSRLLGLAETNHGANEFTRERARLAIELARKRAFNVIFIEAGYSEFVGIDDYIKGANVSIEALLADNGFWIWNTKELLSALGSIRAYNRGAAPDRRISIVGVDIQGPKAALAYLLRDPRNSPSERVALEGLGGEVAAQWKALAPERKRAVRAMLDQRAGTRDASGIDSATNRFALAARSLRLGLDYLDTAGFWNQVRLRDRCMADMVSDVLERDAGIKATIWAHLGHLSRSNVVGAPTVGAHLTASYGTTYRVYAFLAYRGTARARSLEEGVGVVSHRFAPAPPYTLEGALTASLAAPADRATYWEFSTAAPATAQWLRELHLVRSFGSLYPGDEDSFKVNELSAVDGAVLFDTVTATESPAAGAPPRTSGGP